MGLSVQRAIAALAVLNIFAIVYFFTHSSSPQPPVNHGIRAPDHSKSFLSDSDPLSAVLLDPLVINDSTDHNQLANKTNLNQNQAASNLQYSLNESYQGIINPFRILGFYKELSPEKHLGPYFIKHADYYSGTFFGLKVNQNYCDYSDLYNIMNPRNVFDHKHFAGDYPNKTIIPMIGGVNLMPQMTLDMVDRNKPILEMDLRVSMFVTKQNVFHYSQKIGKQFLCASQMYNHIPGNQVITRKDYLTETVNAYSDYYALKPYCFNKESMVPRSYRLMNETECKQFFAVINSESYLDKKKEVPFQYVIKIAAGAHKGTGVFLFDETQEKTTRSKYANGKSCGQVNEALVAQKYIANPILLDKKNKFDFRMYMLLASVDPIILYYHDGFLRVSLSEYDLNSTEKSTHLTNTHLSKTKFAEVEGNETLEEELRDYQMWTMEELQEYLLEAGKIDDPDWLDNYLRPQFKKAYIHMTRMSHHGFWKHSSVYEMFGVDFMLDDNFHLWLIECNSSPQFIGTTPTKEKFLIQLLSDNFEIQYAYLRSRWKRILAVVKNFLLKVMSSEPFDLEHERQLFDKANKNFLEPEYKISENNSWVKILDENIGGKASYMGNLEDDCIID